MLKGIHPLIGAELLAVLARMGHGDEITIVDANFPAVSVARHTVHGTPLQLDRDAVVALEAVLTLLPLDTFKPDPVLFMQVVDQPEVIPPVVEAALPALAAEGVHPASLERFAFYARAKTSFAILHTTEARKYGNFILRKGVIAPD